MNENQKTATLVGELVGRLAAICLISFGYANVFHLAFSEYSLLQSFVICYVFTLITFKL